MFVGKSTTVPFDGEFYLRGSAFEIDYAVRMEEGDGEYKAEFYYRFERGSKLYMLEPDCYNQPLPHDTYIVEGFHDQSNSHVWWILVEGYFSEEDPTSPELFRKRAAEILVAMLQAKPAVRLEAA